MTEQTKQLVADAKTTEEKIRAVNKILQDGEPANVSVDTYSNFTGYRPQYIVDAMNAAFGIGGWGFEEISSRLEGFNAEKQTPTLAVSQVKAWIKAIDFMPVGYGQSRITKGDLGDARKGAQTDAIKKSL